MTGTPHPELRSPAARRFYRPCLVVAAAAGAGIVVGGMSPWLPAAAVTFTGLSIGTWGITTVVVGAFAVVGAVCALVWGLTRWRNSRWLLPLLWCVAVAGVWCLAVSETALIRIRALTSTFVFDVAVGVDAGWGLWLVSFSAAVLFVATSFAAVHAGKVVERYAPSGQSWTRRCLIAAVVAALVLAAAGSFYATTGWHYRPFGDEKPHMPAAFTAPLAMPVAGRSA